MNGQTDTERSKQTNTWLTILVVGVALIICYAAVATAGLMAVYPPARTLVYGLAATDPPTPLPGAKPTRKPPTPTRLDVPTEIVVQASIFADAPTLYDFAPAWQELTSPGSQDWNISFAYDQTVSLYTGWCAATSAILDENYAHITYRLQIDLLDFPVDNLTWLDEPGNGGVCRSYSGLVQAWPPGAHTIVQSMHLDRAIDDGWNEYPAGDYVDRFNINVTP
jgi:hypothetical protein